MKNSRPIIVGGCPRSGTTLMRRILNNHSRIHCGSEVKFFEDLFNDYRLDDQLKNIRFFNTARNLAQEEDVINIFGNGFVKLHEVAANKANKVRWADKCPSNVIYLNYWESILKESFYFVHVVRNPLDTLASLKEMEFDKSVPANFNQKIDFYINYMKAGLAYEEIASDRYIRVIYEELVSFPEQVVSRLMSYLGESFEESQLKLDKPSNKGIEDPKINTTKTVHTSSFGRWNNILTPSEAVTTWEICKPIWHRIDKNYKFISGLDSDGNIVKSSVSNNIFSRFFIK
ncbi:MULTISPECIES: sulfotransferase family protein [Methylomonas]|uniref:sulfotransferase family protein n=1 Tax=Methylomonas TaxID=416 RepID=UPI0012325658|nr:sulfotransferase [Methylomonas rhizoryzae]